MGGPWNMVEGDVSRLDADDAVIMDALYMDKLGVRALGEQVEIVAHGARVMGFTMGIRSFTTSPYVFTDYRNGHLYSRFAPGQVTYVLVKAAPGVDMEDLRARIAARVAHVDVFTTGEFSQKTREYWMLSTGAGGALVLAAVLGLVVGMVIVAQTLYATTMDHLPEFATLKAMGAPDGYVLRIIMGQAVISAVLGYGLGMVICFGIAYLRRYGETAILVSAPLAAGMFVLTLVMCIAASVISIRKVLVIDPAIVFKGR